ncbi:hypothetical protein [uncultured Rikenella sp.]|nr:hypothetical protein [uncultured Rikenella sp.]
MDITCRGDSWSASVKETNGMNLNFRSTYLDPDNAGLRGHGLPLRCLSE